MKVKSIARHTVIHMWKAYVKKLLNEHPEYFVKRNKSNNAMGAFYVYTMIKDSEKKMVPFCVIDYEQFRKIITQFLERGKEEIIQGNSISIPGCGRIAATRIERDFRAKRKMKDWKRTMASGKNPETGKYNKVYYFTSDDYSRIAWFKTSYISNIRMYEFIPAQSGMCGPGFRTEFSRALDADPLLKYRFIFSPLTCYILNSEEQEEIDNDSKLLVNG